MTTQYEKSLLDQVVAEQASWLNLFKKVQAASYSGDVTELRRLVADASVQAKAGRIAETIASRNSWTQRRNEQAAADAARRQAILDADESYTGDETCHAGGIGGHGRFGLVGRHDCNNRAKVRRTYKVRDDREMTILLCGTHRQVKGQYGFPY